MSIISDKLKKKTEKIFHSIHEAQKDMCKILKDIEDNYNFEHLTSEEREEIKNMLYPIFTKNKKAKYRFEKETRWIEEENDDYFKKERQKISNAYISIDEKAKEIAKKASVQLDISENFMYL